MYTEEQDDRERKDALAVSIEVLLMREPGQAERVIAAQLLVTAQVVGTQRAGTVAYKLRAAAADIDRRSPAFHCRSFTGLYTDDLQCDVILAWGKYRVQLLGGLDKPCNEAYLISPWTQAQARLAHAAEAVKEEIARLE